MADEPWSIEPSLVEDVDAATASWQQGDVFANVSIVRYANADFPLTLAASRADGGPVAIREPLANAAIISQTCEVVRSCVQRPMIHIASVVSLDGAVLNEARRGWRPQYVAVPWAGDDQFADLEMQGLVEKSVLLQSTPIAPCPGSDAAMRFSSGVARHRSRFAFPDDVAPTLAPLIDRFREKSGKDTPQGRRIDEILEIRAQATPDWFANDVSVELTFLIESARLPSQANDAEPSPDLLVEIGALDAQRLAELLDDDSIDAVRRNALWQRLVDAWAERAKPTGAIREVTARAVPLSEFTRLDDLATAELDLDYLSS